jgi:hypothetical protein
MRELIPYELGGTVALMDLPEVFKHVVQRAWALHG